MAAVIPRSCEAISGTAGERLRPATVAADEAAGGASGGGGGGGSVSVAVATSSAALSCRQASVSAAATATVAAPARSWAAPPRGELIWAGMATVFRAAPPRGEPILAVTGTMSRADPPPGETMRLCMGSSCVASILRLCGDGKRLTYDKISDEVFASEHLLV